MGTDHKLAIQAIREMMASAPLTNETVDAIDALIDVHEFNPIVRNDQIIIAKEGKMGAVIYPDVLGNGIDALQLAENLCDMINHA